MAKNLIVTLHTILVNVFFFFSYTIQVSSDKTVFVDIFENTFTNDIYNAKLETETKLTIDITTDDGTVYHNALSNIPTFYKKLFNFLISAELAFCVNVLFLSFLLYFFGSEVVCFFSG